jgi:hypothetical protein
MSYATIPPHPPPPRLSNVREYVGTVGEERVVRDEELGLPRHGHHPGEVVVASVVGDLHLDRDLVVLEREQDAFGGLVDRGDGITEHAAACGGWAGHQGEQGEGGEEAHGGAPGFFG